MFIAFDGIDGSGKSVILEHLVIDLESMGYKVSLLDFGGGNIFKQMLREIRENKNTLPRVRELVFYFEGLHTYINNIKPFRVDHDRILIIDRYLLTYYVYGQLNGMSKDEICFFTKNIEDPDMYFFLDNDPAVALDRILKSRGYINPAETGYSEYYNTQDNFESIPIDKKIDMFLAFQGKAVDYYRKEFDILKATKYLIDATKDKETVYNEILSELKTGLLNPEKIHNNMLK